MMNRAIKIFIFLGLLFFASISGYLYFNQEKLLFGNKIVPMDFTYKWDEPCEEVFIPVDKTSAIHALYFKTENPKGVVLYLHGKGWNLFNQWGKRANDFTKRGFNVLMFDYRGFGKSHGKLTQKTLLTDAECAYQFLQKDFSEKSITVYGCSLGTGIAVYLASQHHPKALILEAPYKSIFNIAKQNYPYMPRFLISLILKYPLRAEEWIDQVDCPIYAFHGTEDEMIPYECSLKKNTQSHNFFFTAIEKGSHDLYRSPQFQEKLSELLSH